VPNIELCIELYMCVRACVYVFVCSGRMFMYVEESK
jgi:hypothetical protein